MMILGRSLEAKRKQVIAQWNNKRLFELVIKCQVSKQATTKQVGSGKGLGV